MGDDLIDITRSTCRACLENTDDMRSIFQAENILNKNIKLCTVLNYCTSLDIYEGDGLPTQICDTCANEVVKAFTFKQQFIRANTILREQLANISISSDKNSINYTFEHVVVKQDSEEDETNEVLNNDIMITNIKHDIPLEDENSVENQIDDSHFNDNDNHFSDFEEKYEISEVKDKKTISANIAELENFENGSDNETLKKKKEEIQAKLKTLPGSSVKSELTDRALDTYLKEMKKRPKDKRDFKCEICSKVLCSATSLKTHKLTHTNETPFLCSICGKGFKTKTTYQEHLVTHDPSEPFKCNKCEKTYKNERRLKDHHLRAHSKVKPFLCGVCGKGLTQKDSLMKHMMIHTGEKPFECDLCGKHFRYMSVLKLHKRYHTGERPYPCTECDKRFKERTHLRKHLMIHTGEKPYECDFCGKCFHTRTNLNSHRKIHTGERNHKCPVCGKGFIQPNCMRAHLATHDKQKNNELQQQQQQIQQQQQVQPHQQQMQQQLHQEVQQQVQQQLQHQHHPQQLIQPPQLFH